VGAGVTEHDGGHGGDVVLSNRGHAALARRAADNTVRPDQHRQEIGVEVVAQERERQSARADVLLGGPVVPGQGERGRGIGAAKRHVDQVTDPGRARGVDERPVLGDPVRGLGPGHHQHGVGAREGGADRGTVAVLGPSHHRTGQLRRACGVTDHEPLGEPGRGEALGHAAPEAAGGPGDGDHPHDDPAAGSSDRRLIRRPPAAPS
jgi:hypothetical protein